MIRAALAIVALLCSAAVADHEQYQSKKDRLRAAKSPKHGPLPKLGTKPAQLVNLYNSWTHEWLSFDATGAPTAETVNQFLRDHFTNQPSTMEPLLIPMVAAAATKFRSDTAIVVSAFRHPKYNLMLRKKGRNVAKDSEHTKGHAVDFWLPRVDVKDLYDWAMAHQIGGVGFYADSGFVHVDTGKKRTWNGE